MKDQSFEDIINDMRSNVKTTTTQYAKLYQKAKAFIEMYEKAFGAPDKECKEFWELRQLIK